jgi:hypothetical protein
MQIHARLIGFEGFHEQIINELPQSMVGKGAGET